MCTPLDRDRPLWAALWVTGLTHDRAALVLVMHHILTDGVGGIAVLAALADGYPGPKPAAFRNLRRPVAPWPALLGGCEREGWHGPRSGYASLSEVWESSGSDPDR